MTSRHLQYKNGTIKHLTVTVYRNLPEEGTIFTLYQCRDLPLTSSGGCIFAALSGGQAFSTLDLSHAYLQVEDCKKFLTINTHKGLFMFNRLPFGVASAPAIFQRIMDSLLQGLSGVSGYLD